MPINPLRQAANAVGLLAVVSAPGLADIRNDSVQAYGRRSDVSPSNEAEPAERRARPSRADTVPAAVKTMRERFADLRALPDGWDGPASVAPDSAVAARAASILEYALGELRHIGPPMIVPVADGGVQAEWYSAEHRFEIYFDVDGQVAAWTGNRRTGVEFEAEGSDAIQMLVQWADRMDDDLIRIA